MRTLLLFLLLLSPASAQPWASDAARAAGRDALAAAATGRFAEAESLARGADPMAAKLVTWWRLSSRNAPATAAELIAWLDANPDWPFPDTLARRAEDAIVGDPTVRDADVISQLSRAAPRTLPSADRLAEALARAGRGRDAAAVIAAGWRDGAADPIAEDAFLQRHGARLGAADHQARFDRLIWDGQPAAAGRAAARLEASRAGIAGARLALRDDRATVEPPTPNARDLGLLADRARFLRRRDRDAEAAAAWAAAAPLQRGLPPEAARAIWVERQVLARKLLRLRQPELAYQVAAAHGQEAPGEPRQEGEFLAGFIALRFLNNAAAAERHFSQVGADSVAVITLVRSAYWQGMALAALGRGTEARARLTAAASFPTAFYGQLASVALGETPAQLAARINATALPPPDPARGQAFVRRELAQAVVTLADLDQSTRARIFLLRMEDVAADATDRWMIARLAVLVGRPDHAVWVARRAGADGVVLLEDGWPTPYPTPPDMTEPALVNAITRQESNFELTAVSSASARGPMQLLPSTAAQVARRLGIPHNTAMLTRDAAHNMRLGSAYISSMLGRFGGAMPLAAAAYNAGPGRVDDWLVTYGDPRQADGPHVLDWIEQIPFSETRNYVQRVIENVVVYRARDPAGAGLPNPLSSLMEGRR
jgi:soluble lytic murein transglycosylase